MNPKPIETKFADGIYSVSTKNCTYKMQCVNNIWRYVKPDGSIDDNVALRPQFDESVTKISDLSKEA